MKFTRNPPRRNPQDSWSERVAALESEKAQADVHSAGFQDYIGGDAGSVPYWTVPVPFVAEAFAAFRAAQLPPGILRRVARLAGINRRDYDDRQLAVALYRSYLAPPKRLNPADIGAKVHMSRGSRHNPDNSYAVISESPRFASSGMSYAEAKEMADSMGGEVVTVEVARAYKQQMLSEKQGSSFYGTGRSGEFRNVRGRWNPAADPIGRYEALRRMADPSGNASANERQMAELLMAKIEAKLGYVPAAPVTKPTRSTGRKGAAKAIAARRHLENSRRNPDYSHMSQEDLARAYLQGYAAYQEAAADRGYALRKMDEASPREEGAARQAFEAAAAVAEKAMHAYNQFFPLLTEETKQKYLMMRAVASLRMDGTSSIQSAPQDVSRVRAMSRRNPELTLKEQYRAHGGIHWFNDKDLMDRYTRGEPPPGGARPSAAAPPPTPAPRPPPPPPPPVQKVKVVPEASARTPDILRRKHAALEPILEAHAAWIDSTLPYKRTSGTGKRADLSGAEMSRMTLFAADLRKANMAHANLSEANLNLANLAGADLSGADLTDANLKDADLRDANLKGADLRRANMTGANLRNAQLSGALLTGATLPDGKLNK